jgi:class 3 adenylate cyclase
MNGHSERRLVTCLFVDVVGSTDATVQLGPERMQRLLGEAFGAMSSTIAAEGGHCAFEHRRTDVRRLACKAPTRIGHGGASLRG